MPVGQRSWVGSVKSQYSGRSKVSSSRPKVNSESVISQYPVGHRSIPSGNNDKLIPEFPRFQETNLFQKIEGLFQLRLEMLCTHP